MHVSYKSHIASLHYIENFSTYVVSRRHLHIAYFTTRSKGQGQQNKHRRFLERSNEVMEFLINTARSKGQKVKVKPVFPRNVSSCMSLFGIVLHAVHVMFTCYARALRQNRFKPGKNQEKSATSAVATGYINRSATAIAITTVLRSLQSTSIQHHSHAAALRDAATVAVHKVLQVSIIHYLCLYEC